MSRSGRIVRGNGPGEVTQPSLEPVFAAQAEADNQDALTINTPEPEPADQAISADADGADELVERVGELLDQAAAESAPETSSDGTIESLDAELAALAEEMIAGEFADESGSIVASDPPELPNLPPSAEAGTGDPTPRTLTEPPEEPLELPPLEPVLPDHNAPPADDPSPEAAGEMRGATDATDTEPAPPPPSALVEAPAEPAARPAPSAHLARVVAAFAGPVVGRPDRRALIAWAAAVTAFNAACAWGYVLFIRDTRPAHPPQGSVQIEAPGQDPAPDAPREAPQGGH